MPRMVLVRFSTVGWPMVNERLLIDLFMTGDAIGLLLWV